MRKFFKQKAINTFKYSAQLKEGLTDEDRALITLKLEFPHCTFEKGPLMGADFIMTGPNGVSCKIELKTCKRVSYTNQVFDEVYTHSTNGTFAGGSEKALNDGCDLFIVQCKHTGKLTYIEPGYMFQMRNKLLKLGAPLINVNYGKAEGVTIYLDELRTFDSPLEVGIYLGMIPSTFLSGDVICF